MSKRLPLLLTLKAGNVIYIQCALVHTRVRVLYRVRILYPVRNAQSPFYNEVRVLYPVRSPQSVVRSPQSVVRSPQSLVPSPQSVVRSPQSVVRSPQSVVRSPQSVVRSPYSVVRSPHSSFILTGEGIESIVFIFSSAKVKYSWLRLPSPSVFLVYQVYGTCSLAMCKLQALVFLENVLILKVVVYLGEATAIRSGNGSFDRG